MELKEFTKAVVRQVVEGVQEVSDELGREICIAKPQDNRSIELDIAFTVESSIRGGAGIKIFNVVDFGGNGESKNSSIHRIKLGVYVASSNKTEQKDHRKMLSNLIRD